jgi:hypothetical protein
MASSLSLTITVSIKIIPSTTHLHAFGFVEVYMCTNLLLAHLMYAKQGASHSSRVGHLPLWSPTRVLGWTSPWLLSLEIGRDAPLPARFDRTVGLSPRAHRSNVCVRAHIHYYHAHCPPLRWLCGRLVPVSGVAFPSRPCRCTRRGSASRHVCSQSFAPSPCTRLRVQPLQPTRESLRGAQP